MTTPNPMQQIRDVLDSGFTAAEKVDMFRTILDNPDWVCVPSNLVQVPSNELPSSEYRLAHNADGEYWVLFNDCYAHDRAFPSKAIAVLEAWKHSHTKVTGAMEAVRRIVRITAAGGKS